MILHADLSTGASGDKFMGALLELCERVGAARFEDLVRVGCALVPGISIQRTHPVKSGIRATHITIEEHNAPTRTWHQIRALIEDAASAGVFSAGTRDRAIAAFAAVALAEAEVHGREPDHVHFHEVGGADSIVDIVGSSFLLEALAPTALYTTPLALGFGSFVCAHGQMPVPAPATARLIEGLPVYAGAHGGELTTPTGAALARAFVTNWEPLPPIVPAATGYGAGSRDLAGAANVLRIIAGEPTTLAGLKARDAYTIEGCTLLSTNIDHLSPEALAFACEELLAAGALDVWQEPITMKKGRLAVRLCTLVSPAKAQDFAEKIGALTGSLGIRGSYMERTIVPRSIITIDTAYGLVPFKAAELGAPIERRTWLRPEHEAVAAIARKHGLDYNELYEELLDFATR
ncbi:MAG: nickel pincer cofactor biosynthesis protein LarC [Coriobacteriales bacterium]|jgi:uncharacterized protein (TIGR00299 family) protein|nr:nickel pincer cofactor biosynthesis protein LarC [Coriobacteriales bacterium]